MAKHSGKLTKRVVDAWTGRERVSGTLDTILWDAKLSGYGIRANADGSHTPLINYRNRYGKSRRHFMGKVTEAFTAEQARTKATQLLRAVSDGHDPAHDRIETRNALTVNDLLDDYLKSGKFGEKADSTRYVDRGRIERHLRPTLGHLHLDEVDKEAVRKAHVAIRDGKTAVIEKTEKKRGKAVVRGGDGAARMAIRVLRAIFSWAIEQGRLRENPAMGLKLGKDGRRNAILATHDQYKSLFDALDRMEAHHKIRGAEADAIRVLAFTGARRNEIAKAKWSWIDLSAGIITVPAKQHKSGHESGEDKVIPLPSAARAVLQRRERGEDDEYVFPSRGKSSVTLAGRLWQRIKAEAGLPEGIANHALRHSLGTTMAVKGAEAAQIMAALGHSQLSTTQRYLHIARDARADLAEKYTADIATAMTPRAEVVEIRKIND